MVAVQKSFIWRSYGYNSFFDIFSNQENWFEGWAVLYIDSMLAFDMTNSNISDMIYSL